MAHKEPNKSLAENIDQLADIYKKDKKIKFIIDTYYSAIKEKETGGYKLTGAEESLIKAYEQYNEKAIMASFVLMLKQPLTINEKKTTVKVKEGIENIIQKIAKPAD